MATSAEDRAVQYTKIAVGQDTATLKAVLSLIGDIRAEKADISSDIASVRNTNVKALQGVRQAMTSGSFAARTKAWVDLEKFLGMAATNYAKTAYAHDDRLETLINQAVAPMSTGFSPSQVAAKAWETYYTNVNPESQANLATYNYMLDTYGVIDRATGVKTEPTEGTDFALPEYAQRKRALLRDRLAIERANAEKQATKIQQLQEPAQAYRDWLQRTGKQDNDAARDEWYRAMGEDLIARIPGGVAQGAFFDDLEKSVDAMNPELQKRLDDATAREEWAVGLLPEKSSVETEPTWDDIMADWVSQPNVQKWAAENGMDIGSVEQPTPELLQAIKDGKAPGYRLTKWGTIYKKGPDDMRAVKLADKQIKMSREDRSIFRPDDRSRKVEITLKGSAPREADVVQSGLTADGRVLAQLSDGAWVVADPPEDGAAFYWQRVPPEQEDAVRQGAELAPAATPEKVSYGKQEPKTIVGYEQTTRFGDIQGNEYGTSLLDEDGKPVFVADSQVERKTYLTGGPREPKVERAREKWYQRAEARDGTSGKEEQLGDKVDPRAEKMRKAQIVSSKKDTPVIPNAALDEKLQPVPSSGAFVKEHTQRARAGESLGANQDKDAVDSTMGSKPILAPGQQSQTNPSFTRPEAEPKDARRPTPTINTQSVTTTGAESVEAQPASVMTPTPNAASEEGMRALREMYVKERKQREGAEQATP